MDFENFFNSQTNEYSMLCANFSVILSRGDMPHFQRINMPLDFTRLLINSKTPSLLILPLENAGSPFVRILFN
jgi:hypothetical protein